MGFEPTYEGFADPCLTAWRRRLGSFSERARGFEPPVFSLARRRSAAEPRPQGCADGSSAETQNRTGDSAIFSRVLYQLSYLGVALPRVLAKERLIVPIRGGGCQAKVIPVTCSARVAGLG